MQSLNVFYYPNEITVQWNIDPTLQLRNKTMYARTVKIYKGIDNLVKFTFKNAEQKRVNVDGWEIYFNITSDSEGTVAMTKQATVIGDPIKGEVQVIVSELDLIDLEDEFYSYSLSVRDPDTGIEQVIYTDDSYEARGEIVLRAGHYPSFRKSVQVQIPTNSALNITTSTVTADTPTRQQSAFHTAQFYFTNFTGNIAVQTTLDGLPPNGSTSANTSVSWSTISFSPFTEQNGTTYTNWEGVYSAARFVITPDVTNTGTVDKILYRS